MTTILTPRSSRAANGGQALRHLAAAIALVGLAAAGPVLAQEATPDTWLTQVQSTKSRAQVAQELAAARADGSIRAWSAGYMEPLRSTRLRAEVRAETQAAIDSGELQAINAEVYAFQPVPAVRMARSAR